MIFLQNNLNNQLINLAKFSKPIFVLVVLLLGHCVKLTAQAYYYSFNDTIQLQEYQNKYVVKFQDTCETTLMNSIISSVNPSDTVRIVGSYAVFTTTEIENLNNSAVASM